MLTARELRLPIVRSLRFAVLIAMVVGLLLSALAWNQARIERRIDLDDLDRRAQALAHQMTDGVVVVLQRPDSDVAKELGAAVEGHRRLVGLAVFRPDGQVVVAGKAVREYIDLIRPAVDAALKGVPEHSQVVTAPDATLHVLVRSLKTPEGTLIGALAVVHDIGHLEERATARVLQYAIWVVLVCCFLLIGIVGVTWTVYERPMNRLADWMRQVRKGQSTEPPPAGLPVSFLATESERLAASFRALRSHSTRRAKAVTDQRIWTRERLREAAMESLHGGQLIVASNREPYMHQLHEGKPKLIVPAGGLVTALDPVLQACGGVWVAHGAGDADRETADARGRLPVPSAKPRYTLRRVWMSREEEQGYYYGLSNEGLWPLCHLAHERPVFRSEDWEYYVAINRRFADAIIEEVESDDTMVLVQDYHLALVPEMLKRRRPALRVGIFWHIPWPNAEAFRICPWRAEVLKGILGADLVGFHLQQYCNNFLECVDRMVEARMDWDHFSAELQGHASQVRQFPISVENWAERGVKSGAEFAQDAAELRQKFRLGDAQIILGVDRIDYTKGLVERFRAVARFFEKYPQHRGGHTFVQLGAPSRTHLRRYRDLFTELETLADEINWKFQSHDWKPIHFAPAHHDAATVHAFMHMAPVCVVSSLHDGMNLVAKEYAAARTDGDGVLILSEFAGAARELTDAIIINPYDIEQFADALRFAVEMDERDRRGRMGRMRQVVEQRNIYRWAAKMLATLAATRTPEQPPPVMVDADAEL